MCLQSLHSGHSQYVSAVNHPNLSPEPNQTFPLTTKALEPTKESINVVCSDLFLQRPTLSIQA